MHPIAPDKSTLGNETGRRCDNVTSSFAAREAQHPVLLLREGIDIGAVYSLEHGSLLIGSHPGASVVIRDPGVSRVHARVFRRLDGWYIEDLGSDEGTRVGDVLVRRSRVVDGDVIQLGPAVSLAFTMVSRAQEAALREMHESGQADPVTLALQSRHFEHQLSAAVECALQTDTELCLVRLQLDRYATIFERWGRTAADAVLGHLVATIRQRVGVGQIVARLGDAEFAVLLTRTTLADALRSAERLRIAVAAAPRTIPGALIPLSVSVGVSSLKCGETATCADLVETAHRRLRRADVAGGDRVVASG